MLSVPQKITCFYQDEKGDWVAKMECGHSQHMRHDPPWQNRPWVISELGRQEWVGTQLVCKDCTDQAQ